MGKIGKPIIAAGGACCAFERGLFVPEAKTAWLVQLPVISSQFSDKYRLSR